MTKRFNTTGACVPAKHYIADITDKITQIRSMVELGDYFVINRPRQYGKTTAMSTLNRLLETEENYFPIMISFEGIGSESYQDEAAFTEAFLSCIKWAYQYSGKDDIVKFIEKSTAVDSINELNNWISDLVTQTGGKTVLMIDEVDKSCNNQLFHDFLGMLRDKYLKYNLEKDPTFHSVILAGVHDIKSLKLKIRPGENAQYNSPWNIAADFNVDLSLSASELASMLENYTKEKKVAMDIPGISQKLFYYTSGYPFLASYLCKIIDEQILPGKTKKEWTLDDLENAFQKALTVSNTNFDSLIKNLEDNAELYDLVFKIIFSDHQYSYSTDNPVIHFGSMYGILARGEDNKTRIHNRLYEQRIYNYMASKMETSGETSFNIVSSSYIDKDGSLNLEKAIRRFQDFMKEQYSKKDSVFIERNGRLLFLAFIKPIINGKGFDFKEVQVSEEKRLDVVITYDNKKYIVELKIWRGESYHKEGISQLTGYLDSQNQDQGYLIVYDLRKEQNKTGAWETITADGKTIFTAWV